MKQEFGQDSRIEEKYMEMKDECIEMSKIDELAGKKLYISLNSKELQKKLDLK